MSFSVSFPTGTPISDVATVFDTQVAAIPDGPGKDEAVAVRSDALDLLASLSNGHETINGSVSGSVSPSSASFSISLSFPTVSATPHRHTDF